MDPRDRTRLPSPSFGVARVTRRRFISTTAGGVARLVDSGEWTVDEYLGGEVVYALATGPGDSRLVLAGTEGNGLFRSDDAGATWTAVGLPDEHVMSIAVAPTDTERIYAGVRPPAMYRSDDGAETWTELTAFQNIRGRRIWRSPASPPFSAYVNAIAVSPTDPDLVVAGIEFGAVIRSTDGGESWSNHRRKAIRDCHSLTWHPRDDSNVYEAGAGFPRRPGARSTDGGETWVKPGGGLDRGYGVAVAADPADPECWYVSASTSPFAAASEKDARSTIFRRRMGESWEALEAFPGERMAWALCTDPDRPGELWAGRRDGTVYHSADHGDTWTRLEGRLPEIDRTMVMLPS